jgi:hypothetical protein
MDPISGVSEPFRKKSARAGGQDDACLRSPIFPAAPRFDDAVGPSKSTTMPSQNLSCSPGPNLADLQGQHVEPLVSAGLKGYHLTPFSEHALSIALLVLDWDYQAGLISKPRAKGRIVSGKSKLKLWIVAGSCRRNLVRPTRRVFGSYPVQTLALIRLRVHPSTRRLSEYRPCLSYPPDPGRSLPHVRPAR